MGGDICIIDKDEPGEPGSRFHFTLVFKCTKKNLLMCAPYTDQRQASLQEKLSLQSIFRVNNTTSALSGWQLNPCFQDFRLTSLPVVEGVCVLLAMQGQGGRKVVRKWMERRGLQLWMIDSWGEFLTMVDKMKQDICSDHSFSTSERYDIISPESRFYDGELMTTLVSETPLLEEQELAQMLF